MSAAMGLCLGHQMIWIIAGQIRGFINRPPILTCIMTLAIAPNTYATDRFVCTPFTQCRAARLQGLFPPVTEVLKRAGKPLGIMGRLPPR